MGPEQLFQLFNAVFLDHILRYLKAQARFLGREHLPVFNSRRLGKSAGHPGHTGTIFLDEISETSQSFQTTLLRVIQEMEIRPLGSNKVIPTDIRIIAATNRRLKQEVDPGNFRSDLYYRINILRLNIPFSDLDLTFRLPLQ